MHFQFQEYCIFFTLLIGIEINTFSLPEHNYYYELSLMKLTTPMYERQKKLNILGVLLVIKNRRFYIISKSHILYINIYKMLLQLLLAIIFVVAVSVTYKYYLKPKNEIKRYADTLRSLGYKVYVYPFSFMGLSFAEAEAEGVRLHKDAQYLQKTVFLDIDVAICNCMEKPLIFFTDPDLMKQFLGGNMPYKYPKLETMISGLKAVLGEGLIFSEGESWKKKRKLLSKVFNFDLFKENIPKIIQVCNKCFDKYESTYMVSQNTLKVNSIKFSAGISNGVMMTCFFGNDCVNDTIGDGHNYPEFIHQTTSEAQDLTLDPLIAFLGKFAWKFGVTAKIRYLNHRISMMREKAAKILKDRTDQVLKAPRKQKCSDVIEALVYQKLDNKEEFSYSDNEFVDEFQTILIAGSDTTTTYFTMFMYALGSHPEIHKRMRAEISAIIKSDEDITFENLKKLPYIDWFQYEITRLYGPANGMLFREAEEDNYVKDIPITKGTLVSTQPVGNHYNPKYFKDPYVLRPERWESECDGIHPFAFMGFSYGLRSCIGKHLAILATKIAVIKLIMRYETIEVPQKLTMNLKFMYEPEKFDVTLTKKAAK